MSELLGDDLGDPSHWNHAPEWYGSQGGGWGRDDGQVVFSAPSTSGNGLVTVTRHAFEPRATQGYRHIQNATFQKALASSSLGWRVLRFNGTRQSVNLVAEEEEQNQLGHQIPIVLAFEYQRTLAALVAARIEAMPETDRLVDMAFLGMGAASLPRFVQSLVPRTRLACVDLDPLVLSAAQQHMGIPPSTDTFQMMQGDAIDYIKNCQTSLDLVVLDVFDGEDQVPPGFIDDPSSSFPRRLAQALHPEHGTLLMNLHHDGTAASFARIDAMARTLAVAILRNDPSSSSSASLAFTVRVQRQSNVALCIARGWNLGRNPAATLQKAVQTGRIAKQVPWMHLEDRVAHDFRTIVL